MALRRCVLALALVVLAHPAAATDAIEAAPGLVVDLGSTPRGTPVATTITFANPSAELEMPFGFDADDAGFAVAAPPETLAPGERIEMPITLLADAPGDYELVVRIYRDLGADPPEDGMIVFQVIGTVTP